MGPAYDKGNYIQSREIKSSWGARALEAWYIGTTWDHYMCLKLQVLTTGGIRFSGQYKIYPQHSHVPIEKPNDEATRKSRDLIEEVKGLKDQYKNHPRRHTQALETLTKLKRYSREIS